MRIEYNSNIMNINDWRDRELSKLKKLLSKTSDEIFPRLCVPLIYAHWEGYVVSTFEHLRSNINQLKLKPHQSTPHMFVLALGSSYQSLAGKQNFDQRIKFTENVLQAISKDLTITDKIDTKSNVKRKVFEELCSMHCIEIKYFSDDDLNKINNLVSQRNAIAHGEYPRPQDKQVIIEYVDAISRTVEILIEQIDLFFKEKRYLKI